jgi:iron(III) transport system substrate-binding protein
MRHRHRNWSAFALVAGLCLIAAACSSPPTTPDTGGGRAPTGGAAELEQLYAQLDGLGLEARKAKLIELAKDKGPVDVYSSTPVEDAEVIHSAFTKATGIEIRHYRASADTGRNRLLQEASAGRRGADTAGYDGLELVLLDREGLLLPLKSPYADALPEAARHPNWVSSSYNVFTAAWNTGKVTGDKIPRTWEDVLAYQGDWALEVGDYSWFATLVHDYFMAQKGMTEQQAVDLFRAGMKRAIPVDGHTVMVELLAAGDFDIAASAYLYHVVQRVKRGVPIGWDRPKPVEPLVVRPNGEGILTTADNLPGALLWLDWQYSKDGQRILADLERTVADPEIEGGLDPNIGQIPVNLDIISDEAGNERWRTLFEEIVRQTGREVTSE